MSRKSTPRSACSGIITDDLLLRGAAFQVVKPALADNRTLEPTQVAGFNQLFDEANGTKSRRYGLGLDWRVMDGLFVGAEATWRDLEFAAISFAEEEAHYFDHDEQTHRAYVFWTPLPEVALRRNSLRQVRGRGVRPSPSAASFRRISKP